MSSGCPEPSIQGRVLYQGIERAVKEKGLWLRWMPGKNHNSWDTKTCSFLKFLRSSGSACPGPFKSRRLFVSRVPAASSGLSKRSCS